MTRLYLLLAALLLVALVGNVEGSQRGLRALQDETKEEEGPSDWFGGDASNATNSEGEEGDKGDESGIDVPINDTIAEEAPEEELEPEAPSASEANALSNTTTAEEPSDAAAPAESENSPEAESPAEEPAPEAESPAQEPAASAAPGEGENPVDSPEGEGDDQIGDDIAGDDIEGDDMEGDDVEETEEEWFEEEEAAHEQETKAPYVPPTGDDPFAKEPDESEWSAGEDWKQETPQEMMHDKNVLVALVCAVCIGVALALCSAQQVIDNPNGCCASICRCFVKILCFPCKCCCGGRNRHKHDLMQAGSDSYTHDLELT